MVFEAQNLRLCLHVGLANMSGIWDLGLGTPYNLTLNLSLILIGIWTYI